MGRFAKSGVALGFGGLVALACSTALEGAPGPESGIDSGIPTGPNDGAVPSTPPGNDGSPADGGTSDGGTSDGGTDGGRPPSNACTTPCPAGQKLCDSLSPAVPTAFPYKVCVDVGDIRYGCDPVTCVANACPSNVFRTDTQSTCNAGVCQPGGPAPICQTNWGNCDGNWANGCETPLTTAANCGACGAACAAGKVCEDGTCVDNCTAPKENCGKGDCHDIETSPMGCACKPCGYPGADQVTCNAGVCGAATSCSSGYTFVPSLGGCVDLNRDNNNCGSPGNKCARSMCVSGVCVEECAPGYTRCGNRCVDLLGTLSGSDRLSHDCGACGVTCATDEICASGACVARSAMTIANDFLGLYGLAVDANNVYVSDASGTQKIWKFDKVTLARTQLAVVQSALRITVDATHLYWSSFEGNEIRRIPIGGGAVQPLYPAASPYGIAVDDTNVYWSDDAGIHAAPKAGGGAVTVLSATKKKSWDLRVDATRVYGGSLRDPVGTNPIPKLWMIDKVTKAVTDLGLEAGQGLAVDGVNVWTGQISSARDLRWSPLAGPFDANDFVATTDVFDVAVDTAPGCASAYYLTQVSSGNPTPSMGIYKASAVRRSAPRAVLAGDRASHPNAMIKTGRGIALDATHVYWIDETTLGRAPR